MNDKLAQGKEYWLLYGLLSPATQFQTCNIITVNVRRGAVFKF